MMRPDALPLEFGERQRVAKRVTLGPQAILLTGFAESEASALLAAIDDIRRASPLRHMITPGGWTMSVAMTNCGEAGWVTDRSGYRYDAIDPETGRAWPAMPAVFSVCFVT
jgi:DNA oxidative demethylase